MQTSFTERQLQDPAIAESETILRKCVHCGFCTATCPTYVTLGNELDSPRGRIYLIKDMLENDRPADRQIVTHIDRCLSCLACMTTCPSGVNYMHLVDHARVHIEKTYRRPAADRFIRSMLALILPNPTRFRVALGAARLFRPLAPVFDRVSAMRPLAAMLKMAPERLPAALPLQQVSQPPDRKGRVALLTGCAQSVLDPGINAAATRLLNRSGIEVVLPPGESCCGALVHHIGREEAALEAARNNVDAWTRQIENGGLDAILVTTSGCGTTIKNYGYMLRLDDRYADRAAKVSALAQDITEYLPRCELPQPADIPSLTVAYHAACSMQHGQGIKDQPRQLLEAAGFTVKLPREGHLCCGSAGTYNILQPEIAQKLGKRKIRNLSETDADVIATGNIGCISQISRGSAVPVLHTVKLLDWAYGGDRPEGL